MHLSLRTSVSRYPLSMGSSTSSAISHPAARSASSEKKLSGRGKLPPQPDLELGLPTSRAAKFGSRDNAVLSLASESQDAAREPFLARCDNARRDVVAQLNRFMWVEMRIDFPLVGAANCLVPKFFKRKSILANWPSSVFSRLPASAASAMLVGASLRIRNPSAIRRIVKPGG